MPAEFDFIRWIQTRPQAGNADDCAVLEPTSHKFLLTTDILMDGTDFLLKEAGPRAVGRKAMAVNLSDIAAMGGRATGALLGLVLPQSADAGEIAREIYLGAEELAAEFGVRIVGGDTNSWAGGLVVSITALGESPECGPLLRSGAKPGDAIFVTGPCGGSILGRHLNPRPRLNEIAEVMRLVSISACIDISDGLTADLQHILDASRCGAILDADAIPIHADAIKLSNRTGKTALEHALGDGEDFELLFAVPAAQAEELRDHPSAIRIGECAKSGLNLREATGIRTLAPAGWTHEFDRN